MFDALQILGGIILSVGYVPQIVQILRTRSVRDINLQMAGMVFLGVLLMEVYAVHLVFASGAGHAFFVTNTMSTVLAGILFGLVLRFKSALRELRSY